ncbi:hypothetical protein MRB53_009680 [Persea americana]|uniref:Uncharacterized protein n=1 Tax=Persea americana TaxID=3435 RepID=A0ACC2LQG9_PERAE|nr:hypothetical protein MRB53_009680 [Persea americana]
MKHVFASRNTRDVSGRNACKWALTRGIIKHIASESQAEGKQRSRQSSSLKSDLVSWYQSSSSDKRQSDPFVFKASSAKLLLHDSNTKLRLQAFSRKLYKLSLHRSVCASYSAQSISLQIAAVLDLFFVVLNIFISLTSRPPGLITAFFEV